MDRTSLAGEWQLREVGTDDWYPGTVPGGIYTDLLDVGVIEDPFVADNELDVQWVGETDWEYRRTVVLSQSLCAHQRIVLSCDGIDTVATISINGTEVGTTNNMHRAYEFDVTDQVTVGENVLTVRFRSPVAYAKERTENHPYRVPTLRYPVDQPGRNFIRKAQCHFGWDWGPCLPTVGIWRDISIVGYSTPVVEYIRTSQHHQDGDVELSVDLGITSPTETTATVSASVAGAERTVVVDLETERTEVSIVLEVEDPDLWWPNGHGDQPLYDLTLSIRSEGVVNRATERIGFRELELERTADESGEGFEFVVNGEPIFAKGANWIPIDALYGGVETDRYETLLEDAATVNMNMIRVWGGGQYERDVFYELCDELGLLVWQDFMFACALYPADRSFLDSVENEVRYQVRRLNTHPSLALWCGNNENEEALANWFADVDHIHLLQEDYKALYIDTIGEIVDEEAPDGTYWSGSPSSGPDYADPYRMDRGDVHYWDVWHEGAPFEEYETIEPRFVSEFGYQSFPPMDVIGDVVPASQHNPTAPLMEHHQRHERGNQIILQQLLDSFRVPFSFEDFVYLSQIQQGLAMRTAIEHFRRRQPHCMGALFWQLNDLWPCASWSSIGYGERWKALQYFARRFYAPVLVSLHADSDGSDSTARSGRTTNNATSIEDGPVELWVTNDTAEQYSGTITVTVTSVCGSTRRVETQSVEIEPYESRVVRTISSNSLTTAETPTLITASYDGTVESYTAFWFDRPYKALVLPDATVEATVRGKTVRLSTTDLALFVALDVNEPTGSFSDNYFHLLPDEDRTVQYDGQKQGEQLEAALSVRHLRDTYRSNQ